VIAVIIFVTTSPERLLRGLKLTDYYLPASTAHGRLPRRLRLPSGEQNGVLRVSEELVSSGGKESQQSLSTPYISDARIERNQ